jgi:hypothetical protein
MFVVPTGYVNNQLQEPLRLVFPCLTITTHPRLIQKTYLLSHEHFQNPTHHGKCLFLFCAKTTHEHQHVCGFCCSSQQLGVKSFAFAFSTNHTAPLIPQSGMQNQDMSASGKLESMMHVCFAQTESSMVATMWLLLCTRTLKSNEWFSFTKGSPSPCHVHHKE